MHKVLLVEDEDDLRAGLEISLFRHGYVTISSRTCASALDLVRSNHPDLIVLDVGLPDGNGFDVCRQLRRLGWDMPIIFLTVRDEEVDRIVGLEIGADDYMTKPFSQRELLARIGACLRRTNRVQTVTGFQFSDVDVNMASRVVTKAGKAVKLTDKELSVLVYLIHHRGRVVTRDELLDHVWGYDEYPVTRTVDTHILNLRRKLENAPAQPEHILSVHGEGYKFQ